MFYAHFQIRLHNSPKIVVQTIHLIYDRTDA